MVYSALSVPMPKMLYEFDSGIAVRRRGQTLPWQRLFWPFVPKDKVGIEAEIDLDIVGIAVGVARVDAGEEGALVGVWLYAILQISGNLDITNRMIGTRPPYTSAVSNLKNS
jgi:hypothetical protein